MRPQGILVPYTLISKIPLFNQLPPATQAVLLRALKAAVATAVAILLAAALGGVLFPADWSPVLVIAVTTLLQAIDKWLRATPDPPVTDPIEEPEPVV
jgi:uncharacterized membrane protein YccC